MRVAIFFDGKNFHSGLKTVAEGTVTVDYTKLSQWIILQVGGSRLWGAYYYTGVEAKNSEGADIQQGLAHFLDGLERLPGFFVYRFLRKWRQRRCPTCGNTVRYSQEKEVDTTMVADMLRLAAVNAFDIAVLVSGDSDHAPAVEGVRALGKQVYVTTWGARGLAPRIRKAAYDHIDLLRGLDKFSVPGDDRGLCVKKLPLGVADQLLPQLTITTTATNDELAAEIAFLAELDRASQAFSDGYVGLSHFLRKWKSDQLVADVQIRSRVLDKLKKKGIVEIYQAGDGAKGLRRKADGRKSDVAAEASPQ